MILARNQWPLTSLRVPAAASVKIPIQWIESEVLPVKISTSQMGQDIQTSDPVRESNAAKSAGTAPAWTSNSTPR